LKPSCSSMRCSAVTHACCLLLVAAQGEIGQCDTAQYSTAWCDKGTSQPKHFVCCARQRCVARYSTPTLHQLPSKQCCVVTAHNQATRDGDRQTQPCFKDYNAQRVVISKVPCLVGRFTPPPPQHTHNPPPPCPNALRSAGFLWTHKNHA
jgi:hypothetical protein